MSRIAKSVPLESAMPVVRSPKLPVRKPQRAWRDFDDFAALAKALLARAAEALDDKLSSQDARHLFERWHGVERAFKRFDKAREYFERDALYETAKQARPNLIGCHTHRQIARRVASEQVGLLVGSFPNVSAHSPQIYVRLLIEETIAANPCACALEDACRQIRRTLRFAPTVAELLDVLRQKMAWWSDADAIRAENVEFWRATLADKLTMRDAADA
jgi:hypothetical protein